MARLIWCCDMTKNQTRYHNDAGRVRDITPPVDNPPLRSPPTQGAQNRDKHTLSTYSVKMAFECDGPSGSWLLPSYLRVKDVTSVESFAPSSHTQVFSREMAVVAPASSGKTSRASEGINGSNLLITDVREIMH